MARTDGKLMWQWRYRVSRSEQTAPTKRLTNAEKCMQLFIRNAASERHGRWSYQPR